MSLIKSTKDKKVESELPKFTPEDTEFLLKLIEHSSFQGTQLEKAYIILHKLIEIHKHLVKGSINES
jgi:hypothetical protein|tara:strand:- start:1293 stop:1493 length:201 start_codon:yes stop_codon:yes gene_type:complete